MPVEEMEVAIIVELWASPSQTTIAWQKRLKSHRENEKVVTNSSKSGDE